jgi:hypothetical protein
MRRRIIIGVLAGWALWAFAFGLWYSERTNLQLLRSLPAPVSSCVSVAAVPIAIGGWFFVWGDNGPPYPWLDNMRFNVAANLVIYGILGGVVGYGVGGRRFSVRALLIATTLVALGLGLLVWIAR